MDFKKEIENKMENKEIFEIKSVSNKKNEKNALEYLNELVEKKVVSKWGKNKQAVYTYYMSF